MLYSKIKDDEYYRRVYLLIKQLTVVLITFQFCRILFFIINYNYFFPLKYEYLFDSFLYGIHYDISAIIKYNCLYILLFLIPIQSVVNKKRYRQVLNLIFILLNGIAVLISISDIEYFRFVNKRTTYEFGYYLKTMNIELLKLLPIYAIQYWYLLIGFLLIVAILVKFRLKEAFLKSESLSQRGWIGRLVSYAIVLLFLGVVARGFGKRPLKSSDVERFMPIEYGALATNSPFTIIENYIQENRENGFKGRSEFNLEQNYNKTDTLQRQNVVIIILESFSKEYVGSLNNNKGYTPFLDSLMQQGLTCRNAYANGRTTLQALPAILCGLPSLGELPIIFSLNRYQNLNSIAEILNSEGYNSSFFYGARNGNLGINNFARKAGFQNYFGMNEYGASSDDSPWGVFDDEFLQFAAAKMDLFREPFVSCILTLSSHSPFVIPKKFQNQFQNQSSNQLKSIAYTDYCLKQFFEKASQSSWYNNTLFVIVADHASYPYSIKYNSTLGMFSIPIVYFHNNDKKLRGSYDNVTQQCDIKPSILNYLDYNKKFISFGSSLFSDSKEHYAIMSIANRYQYIDSLNLINISLSGELLSAYKYRDDSLLFNSLLMSNKHHFESELTKAKAIISKSFQ